MNKELFIFDLDGVLVKTSHLHTEALRQAVLEFAGEDASKESFLDASDGKNTISKLNKLAETYNFDKSAVDARKKELTLEKLKTLPKFHLIDYFRELKQHNKILAVASNSRREFVDFILSHIGLDGIFDLVLTGDDVQFSKPHPEIFTKIMHHFNVKWFKTRIFEDSVAGIAAAKASGVKLIITIDPEKLVQRSDFHPLINNIVQKLAFCIYGLTNNRVDLIKDQIRHKFSRSHISFFEEFALNESGTLHSLHRCSLKKRNFEIENHKEFDACIAFDINAIDKLQNLSIVPEIRNHKVYSVTGSFNEPYYTTGIGIEIFYADSMTFDRACEFVLNIPNFKLHAIRGYNKIPLSTAILFYFHLQTLKLNTECINYEDSSLYQRTT